MSRLRGEFAGGIMAEWSSHGAGRRDLQHRFSDHFRLLLTHWLAVVAWTRSVHMNGRRSLRAGDKAGIHTFSQTSDRTTQFGRAPQPSICPGLPWWPLRVQRHFSITMG